MVRQFYAARQFLRFYVSAVSLCSRPGRTLSNGERTRAPRDTSLHAMARTIWIASIASSVVSSSSPLTAIESPMAQGADVADLLSVRQPHSRLRSVWGMIATIELSRHQTQASHLQKFSRDGNGRLDRLQPEPTWRCINCNERNDCNNFRD